MSTTAEETALDINQDSSLAQDIETVKRYARLMVKKDRERVTKSISALCFDLDIEAVVSKTPIIID